MCCALATVDKKNGRTAINVVKGTDAALRLVQIGAGECVMNAVECKEHAAECRRMAQCTANSRVQAILIDMAHELGTGWPSRPSFLRGAIHHCG
jgi:hypothetical protein